MRGVRIGLAPLAVAVGLLLGPPAASALEPLAVYEDWLQGSIRADRWKGEQSSGSLEVKRVVMPDYTLLMRLRREGATTSNSGNSGGALRLDLANPASVNEIEAPVTVTGLSMTTCAANNAGAATRARPVVLQMNSFNDGSSSGAGDRTGDHFAGVQAFRDGSSADPAGVLRIQGFVNRCTNASCGSSVNVAFNNLVTTVAVGQAFTLRIKWDQPAHQFLFGLDGGSDVSLSYTPASDTAPAIVQSALIAASHTAAACTAGAVSIDSTIRVGTVMTNSSAVIP